MIDMDSRKLIRRGMRWAEITEITSTMEGMVAAAKNQGKYRPSPVSRLWHEFLNAHPKEWNETTIKITRWGYLMQKSRSLSEVWSPLHKMKEKIDPHQPSLACILGPPYWYVSESKHKYKLHWGAPMQKSNQQCNVWSPLHEWRKMKTPTRHH